MAPHKTQIDNPRPSGRAPHELRITTFELDVAKHAEGSCLVRAGDTHVLCTASLEERVPLWLRNKKRGWITAEYGMLPRATNTRMRREASIGRQSGRTQEIQRLIGRSLRSVANLDALGERQIAIDCDVLQADGGTRTASISGSWLALYQCLDRLGIREAVLRDHVAAISCGIVGKSVCVDLDYMEDSTAQVDANFVMSSGGKLIEIQASAESAPFMQNEFEAMLTLATRAIAALIAQQKHVLTTASIG